MKSSDSKAILWLGIRASEYHAVYSHQISQEFEHVVCDSLNLDCFDSNQYHCCFIFGGFKDQEHLRALDSLRKSHVFLFIDAKSVVEYRTNNPGATVSIDQSNFRFFSNENFVDICLDFDLIGYKISYHDSPQPAKEPSLFQRLDHALEETNVWTKSSALFCEIESRVVVLADTPLYCQFDDDTLMQSYTYIGGVTSNHVIQILYPSSKFDYQLRQYLTALAKKFGTAKTLSLCSMYKPLRKIIVGVNQDIELYKLTANAGSEVFSVFFMFTKRAL